MTVNEEQRGIRAISCGSSPEQLDSFPGVLTVREQIPVDDPSHSIDEQRLSRRTRHEHERNYGRTEPSTNHRSSPTTGSSSAAMKVATRLAATCSSKSCSHSIGRRTIRTKNRRCRELEKNGGCLESGCLVTGGKSMTNSLRQSGQNGSRSIARQSSERHTSPPTTS